MCSRVRRRSLRQATVRVGGIVVIPAILREFGVDPDEVLIAAGIDPDALKDPDNLIAYAARGILIKHCMERTGCQHIGLLIGQQMDMPALGLVGLLMKSMPNVGAALKSLETHFYVHSPGAVPILSVDGDLAWVTYDIVVEGVEARDQIGDGAVAMILNVMRSLCGPRFQALEASFVHRRPADIKPFREFFRIPLYFDAPRYAVTFSRKWLDARPASADAELQRVLQKQIDALESPQDDDVAAHIKTLLRSAILTGHSNEHRIAAFLGVGSRTLIRRLESAGTSFHELVDEVRFELSRQFLKDSSLSISEIGDTLGYSRASAFTRAFRRWSGTTPRNWRATHAGHDSSV
jgi:AraC-like DNA-binding protein